MTASNKITIGKVAFGEEYPFVVIPEACDNHHGNLDEAKELAAAAKEAGAEIIKFQLHLPDEEMDKKGMAETSSEMFKQWGDLYGFIEENLLAVEDHAELIKYCEKIGIQYLCTPFSSKAAEILKEIGGDFAYKIGSGETEDLPMIENIADLGKPMLVSTGMSTFAEIDLTVNAIRERKTPFALLHCISAYPPKSLDELHLGVISELHNRYDALVGFSDHTSPEGITTRDGEVISEDQIMWGAMGQGARFIEKHFTINRASKDADSRFSHDPTTLERLIKSVKYADEAMDKKREVYNHEKDVWIWAKRSMFAIGDIPKGTKIKRSMLKSKRPGTGIRSKNYKSIIGKKVKRNIKKDQMLLMRDIV